MIFCCNNVVQLNSPMDLSGNINFSFHGKYHQHLSAHYGQALFSCFKCTDCRLAMTAYSKGYHCYSSHKSKPK